MLLKTLKSNSTVNFFLYPLMGFLFWLRDFISPGSYAFFPGEYSNILYAPLHNLLKDYPLVQILFMLLLLIGMALVLIQMNNKFNIIRIRTMLPAPLFILLVSGFTGIHAMHPVYFAAFFVLLSVYRLFSAFDEVQPYSPAFDSGFFLGLASLFYLSSAILFPAILIGVGILSRETKWREFVVSFLGFLLPFIFAFSYVFIFDDISEFLNVLEANVFTRAENFDINQPVVGYVGLLLILIFMGSIKILRQYDTKKVSTRKFFIILFLIFLFSMLGFLLVPATSSEMFVIAAIPTTFLLSNFFVFLKSRFWGEFWFSLLVIAVLVMEILA